MPLVRATYRPPFLFKSAHYATVWCGLFRKVDIPQKRERITLPDGDFLDLDWSFQSTDNSQSTSASLLRRSSSATKAERLPVDRPSNSSSVAILLHGLEGHAQRPYMTGNANWLNQHGIDACAVNFRGCSGETNKLYRSYHSGATEDLDAVVQHLIAKGYDKVYLVGISLGGNMLLKYLGEEREVPEQVQAGIAISAPCDLYASLQCIMSFENTLYAKRFKDHLVAKLYRKQKLYPKKLTNGTINEIKNLKDFDDIYTSKAHGFADAMDYYEQCSSGQFLSRLKRPALLLNAKDDTFLKDGCYPIDEARRNPKLFLEMPKYGGHVGFVGEDNVAYSERRVLEFIKENSAFK